MGGGYGPMDGPLSQRTVYLGNLHPETTMEELCNVIRGGGLENIKIIPDRGIAFITFLEETNAAHFLMRVQRDGMTVRHRKLKIGWGRPVPVLDQQVREAVHFHGASRNVYIGGLPEVDLSGIDPWSIDQLRHDFEEYGEIEMVNRPGGMDCAFVNYTKIQSAIRAVEEMKIHPKPMYANLRINFGKDRCANTPRNNSIVSMSGGRSITPAGLSTGMSVDAWMMRSGTADVNTTRHIYSNSVVHQFRGMDQELGNVTPAPMANSVSMGGAVLNTQPIPTAGVAPRPLRQGQSVGGVLSSGGASTAVGPGATTSNWRSGSRYMQLRKDSTSSTTGPPPGVLTPPPPSSTSAGQNPVTTVPIRSKSVW